MRLVYRRHIATSGFLYLLCRAATFLERGAHIGGGGDRIVRPSPGERLPTGYCQALPVMLISALRLLAYWVSRHPDADGSGRVGAEQPTPAQDGKCRQSGVGFAYEPKLLSGLDSLVL
jgi:hypothetical protein